MEGTEKTGADTRDNSEKTVLLRVLLQRHGPKLSAVGEKNELAPNFITSVKKGFADMAITDGTGLVGVASSPEERAEKTADIDLAEISETPHRHRDKILKRGELETGFAPSESAPEAERARYDQSFKTLKGMQANLEPSVKAKVADEFPTLSPQEQEIEIKNIIDMAVLSLLFDKNKSAQQGIQSFYEEVADKLGGRYKGFLKKVEWLKSMREKGGRQPKNEPYIQIDVSHSFPIMCLLKKFLVFNDGAIANNLSPEEFFARTGGVIRESGSLALNYELEGDKYIIKVTGEFAQGNRFNGQLNFNQQIGS